jgi:NADPH2:quinone reductase
VKAALIQETGEPSVLQYQNTPTPDLTTPTDVRVRLKAAGINPIDTKLRRGMYPMTHFPAILGCDGAGVVEKVGDQVKTLQPGDEVFFFYGGLDGVPGNYAEYIVLDERFAIPKPDAIDFIQAAAAPLVSLTAWEALHDRAGMKQGDCVLIHGGAGGVGHVAIQIAKRAGAQVCTTVSNDEKAAFVKKLGADYIINYRETNFVDASLEWTDGQGVDIVMDNVGGSVIPESFAALKPYGNLVTLLKPEQDTDWTLARQRNLRLGFEVMLLPQVAGLLDAQQHQSWILQQCARMMQDKELVVFVNQTLPLDNVTHAHEIIETRSTTGKIVLEID